MTPSIARSGLAAVATATLAALCAGAVAPPVHPPATARDAPERLAGVERGAGCRLGVAALDTGSLRTIAFRASERFPMCSTFKVLLAAATLARVDAGRDALDRRIAYGRADLLAYAPITTSHVADGAMTVEALCAAAVEVSDNTAANLLLAALGGPAGVTAFARSLGDGVTRLDRTEPELNASEPGDPRDTTSPAAMAASLREIVLGGALAPASRRRLETWMAACSTGGSRLRAGFPAGWAVGDKTGSGQRGTVNDVAIVRPPGRPPIVVAAYLTDSIAPLARREAALAEVARIVADELGR